jgi:hypothetical protein
LTMLKSPHKDWRLPAVSVIEVRAVGLDQLLTQLWLRVKYGNHQVHPETRGFKTIAELANALERQSESFRNFGNGLADAWLRADLVKILKRKPDRFSVARPLHTLALRLRNSSEDDDSSASEIVYGWLATCDEELLADLQSLIEVDVHDEDLDLASLALAMLGDEQPEDRARTKESPRPVQVPLCFAQARLFADDLRRIMAYRDVVPRPALIEHIRRLAGLHLGLYLLRVFRIATSAERSHGTAPTCETCKQESGVRCPYKLDLIVDCGEDPRSEVAHLAEDSWAVQEDHLARYVRSHLALKKLDELAEYLDRENAKRALPHATVQEIAAIEILARRADIDSFFSQRIDLLNRDSMPSSSKVASSRDGNFVQRILELRTEYSKMGLSPFRSYVTILADFSEKRWVRYHRYLLDSLFGKNVSDGLLRQPLGGRRRRRVALTPGMLETLTMASVVVDTPAGPITRPMRVDILVDRLATRYDLLISTPPDDRQLDTEVTRILALNTERFKSRLRETGLFVDLSDAFLAQTVRPRHALGKP